MKDIRPALRSLLLDDLDVSSIVVTRVYPVVLPQGVTDPSIVYNVVAESTDYNMNGPSRLKTASVQIDCFARAPDQAVELSNCVKGVLSGFRGTVNPDSIIIHGVFHVQGRGHYDSVAKLHISRREYLVWYFASDSPEFVPISSAGVFDSAGALVRTLWSAVDSHPDVEAPGWDGRLDDLSVAPAGNYTIKVLQHRIQHTWEGVIGNTSPISNHGTMTYHNGAATATDMEITSDGVIYYTTAYNERWPCMEYSTVGNPQMMDYPVPIGFRSHYTSAQTICADETYVYYGFTNAFNPFVSFVWASQRSDKALVTFPSGVDEGGFNGIAIETHATPFQTLIGCIAVQKGASPFLFVGRSVNNKVLTLNKTSGATLQTNLSFTLPVSMEVNPVDNDELWLIHEGDRATKLTVDGSGNLTSTGVVITGLDEPASLSISPDGTTVLIVCSGTKQQVLAFNTSDGSVKTEWGTSGAFGELGGHANGPQVTNTRFMFRIRALFNGRPGVVAYAPDGSWWLVDSGNYRRLHFSAGNSPSYLETVACMPAHYACRVCRNDPTRVFCDYLEFTVNYTTLPLDFGNGSWVLAYNWSHNIETLCDGVNDVFNRMRDVGTYAGRTFALYVTGSGREVFELESTGLRPTGAMVANGVIIDDDFNIWAMPQKVAGQAATIHKNPFTGLDGSNNPTWAYPTSSFNLANFDLILTTEILPALFPNTGVADINFQDPAKVLPTANNIIPVMDPSSNQNNHFGGFDATTGLVKFSTCPAEPGFHGSPAQLTILEYPEAPFHATLAGSFYSGGPFLYKPGHEHIFTNVCGEGWGNNQTNMFYHWHDSGLLLKQFGVVGPYQGIPYLTHPDASGDDIPSGFLSYKGTLGFAGNTRWGGIVHVDDKYYIYQNDEWYHGGIHRWRVENLDSLNITETRVSWDEDDYVAPNDPNDLLQGLEYDDFHTDGVAGWTRFPLADTGAFPYSNPHLQIHTNGIVCDKFRSPDITLSALTLTNAYVHKAIPRVGTGNWRFDAEVLLGMGYEGSADFWIAFEILDDTDKVILTIRNFWNTFTGLTGTKVNEVSIPEGEITSPGPGPQASQILHQVLRTRPLPLIIEADVSGGTLQVTYGELLATRTVYEVGADIVQPTKVKLNYREALNFNFALTIASISKLDYSEPVLLLDNIISVPIAAWSLRKLREAYAGPAIRIRSNHGFEKDIGFLGNDVDTVTAASFLAIRGGPGFIVKWYDQSGNGNDLVQADPGNQPGYDATGLGGMPTITWNGINTRLAKTSISGFIGDDASICGVIEMSALSESHARIVSYVEDGNLTDWNEEGSCAFMTRSSSFPLITATEFGGGGGTQTLAYDTPSTVAGIFDGTNHTSYVNNVAGTPVALGIALASPGTLGLGYFPVENSTHLAGKISEMMVFVEDISSRDRNTIHVSQDDYWLGD